MKAYKGILRELTAPHEFHFLTNKEELLRPIKGDYEYLDGIPLESPIEVVLRKEIEDGEECYYIESWAHDFTVAPKYVDETRKDIAVILCFENVSSDKVGTLKKRTKLLRDQVRKMGRGKWEVEATPYVIDGMEITSVTTSRWNEIIDEVNRQNPDNTHNYYHVIGARSSHFCGNAYMNSNKAFSVYSCAFVTMVHEQGHNFGLHHSGSEDGEYRDPISWMGNRGSRNAWLGPHLDYMGLLNPELIKQLQPDTAERFFLADPEMEELALKPGEIKLVYVNAGDPTRQLSVALHGNRVYIHRPDPMTSPTWRKTFFIKSLAAGDSYIAEGIYVRCDRIENGTAEVVVKWNDSLPEPAPRPMPEYVIPDEGHPIDKNMISVWRNPDWSMQGLLFHVIDEPGDDENPPRHEVAATWYTWDRENNLEWRLLQGTIENNVAYVTIYVTNGQRQMWIDGEGIIYFYNKDEGIFKYISDEFGRGVLPLHRLIGDYYEHEQTGLFTTVEREREGFSVLIEPDGQLNFWWYGYDPAIGVIKPARPRWIYGDGVVDEPFTLYRPEGGFHAIKTIDKDNPSEIDAELVEVGEGTITRSGDDLNRFQFETDFENTTVKFNKLA